ncbi:MAG: LamG-like jellyroll fold domain-containing protein [Verrucomicrobiales bacterium]
MPFQAQMMMRKPDRAPLLALIITAFALSAGSASAAELLGFYQFEENYEDSSPKNADAVPSQNPEQLSFSAGFRGRGLDVNDPDGGANTGGSVDLPIDVNPAQLPGVTFGGWVKIDPTTVGDFDGFMAIDNGGWDRGLTVNAQASNSFGIASGEAPTNLGEIVAATWQYVVGTFDIETGVSSLYVGNADAATQTTATQSGNDLTQVGEPVIEVGRYDNQDLDAVVDDIFVFQGALTPFQVNAIRNLRLSNANLSPAEVNEIFILFDGNASGLVKGANWQPITGLPTENPGALIDRGNAGKAVVLDATGKGMLGEAKAFDVSDSDGDGLNDVWENIHFGNLAQTASGDPDADNLTNAEEFTALTLPTARDTDGDGLDDGAEVKTHLTDPTKADADGDGLNDGREIAARTDPTKADTDGDGFNDRVELEAERNPLDPNDKPIPAPFGLIGYYTFDDTYLDASENGNTAVPTQNPSEVSFSASGFRGKSLNINDPDAGPNSGGSVNLPINANPAELPGVTFGGWVNVDSATLGEFDGFMAIDNGGWDRGITVNAQSSNSFGVASGEAPTSIGQIVADTWQYVVGTFDSETGVSSIYVGDAVAATQATETQSGQDLTQVGEPMIEIGRYDNQDLDALVDDIFVFNTSLSNHHVNAIRNLRLSTLNYTPRQAAELFQLFATNASGKVGGTDWAPTVGLDAASPGALTRVGTVFTLVLDSTGKGMTTSGGATDTDGDGLDDLWETNYFGNLTQTAAGDPDGDTLSNAEEFVALTNPTVKDTDSDGLDDAAEVKTHGTDPLKADTDGDLYSDQAEVAAGTDPKNPSSLPREPAPPLLAYYAFEDSYLDGSGNNLTARPEQNPDQVQFAAGLRGRGADINDPDSGPNSGGSINIPIDANPDLLPDVSFGGWVKVETFEFDGFMATDNGGWDRGLTVNAENTNGFGLASGGAPLQAGPIAPGEWQYVVGTFSKPRNRTALYVGDASAATMTSVTATGRDLGVAPGETEIEIGRYDNQDLDGVVDDIFVFGGALSAHQVNAIRNLRLSTLDYSPREAATLFDLFSRNASGPVGAFTWSPASGLAATTPGAVVEAGGTYTLVLDNGGNGMKSGPSGDFKITSVLVTNVDGARRVTLRWTSQTGRTYAVDAAPNLNDWLEITDGIPSGGTETSFTDMSPGLASQAIRYYRVRQR